MGTFKDLYDKQFEVHTESMVEDIHTEGIIDNIVDWIKGEKLVALSRFKYLNQFCKSFEDKEINKGLWKLFMPPSENYVAKLGMYALGRTPGQILKGYIKNIIKGLTPKKEKPEEAGGYYPDTSTNNEKEEEPVKTPDEILQDFQSFADTIDRNAATMAMQPTPVELEKCNYIVKVLHKLQGVKKQDWTDVLEEAKEDMKNSPKFFDFKEQLKPLEHMVDKMEEFRYKWSKFILDNVKFEEVKTRGDDAGSRREVPKPVSKEPSESSTQTETSTTEENVATENFVINTKSYNTLNLFKDLGK